MTREVGVGWAVDRVTDTIHHCSLRRGLSVASAQRVVLGEKGVQSVAAHDSPRVLVVSC